MMKRIQDNNKRIKQWLDSLIAMVKTRPFLAAAAAFAISAALVSAGISGRFRLTAESGEFEAGRVAERDVTVEQPITYVDQDATERRAAEEAASVPAVFRFRRDVTDEILTRFENFTNIAREVFQNTEKTSEDFRTAVNKEFPGSFSVDFLDSLYRDSSRLDDLQSGVEALIWFQEEKGIFALPLTGLAGYNREEVELQREKAGKTESELIKVEDLITLENVTRQLTRYLKEKEGTYSTSFRTLAREMLHPFLSENVSFSPEETQRRQDERRAQVKPVTSRIERGEVIIRKGFVISEEDAAKLEYINQSLVRNVFPLIIGSLMILFLAARFVIFLSGKSVSSKHLSGREYYLVAALGVFYLGAAIFIKNWTENIPYIPGAAFFPNAWLIMVAAMLLNTPIAASLAMFLPSAAFAAHIFEGQDLVFALISGLAAASAVEGANRRMDLLKAGLVTAAFNCAVITAQGLLMRAPPGIFPTLIAIAFVNGIVSGMLVVGSLPLIEQALNTATPFHLIELSGLNAPAMQKLLSAAPGTYNHSLTVANLAESACHDIGANSLLARVGAYYHDIGKMDNPGYFIENQAGQNNKHSEINPRLSATVIRSHVKIGVEKARQLGLPKEVIDIIAEHHGNSVIQWFYNDALKKEGDVNPEDFSYPGNPPRTKESAVVMLADTVEAATRTLKDPGAQRLEKYIQELFDKKLATGQLIDSDLTFRELETIKKAFVRVLVGFYHNRIEYPKEPVKGEVEEKSEFAEKRRGREVPEGSVS